MNRKINIYCEGVTDQVFIADIIEHFFNINIGREKNKKHKHKWEMASETVEIFNIEGCDNLGIDIHINSMNHNTSSKGLNLVVFDADKYGNGNKSLLDSIFVNLLIKH